MKDLRNDLSPPVQKINPAVLDVKSAFFRLLKRLMHEPEVAAVIELPDTASLREYAGIRQRGAGTVFSETGRIYYQGVGRERLKNAVCLLRFRRKVIFRFSIRGNLSEQFFNCLKPAGRPVGHDKPSGLFFLSENI